VKTHGMAEGSSFGAGHGSVETFSDPFPQIEQRSSISRLRLHLFFLVARKSLATLQANILKFWLDFGFPYGIPHGSIATRGTAVAGTLLVLDFHVDNESIGALN
jgi:hypothetical protein